MDSVRSLNRQRVIWPLLIPMLMMALFWSTQTALADVPQHELSSQILVQDEGEGDEADDYVVTSGIVDDRPNETLVGTWVISGTSYTANETTEFGEGSAEIGIGDCVEVKVASDAPTVAIEIEAEDAEDCAEHDGDEKDGDEKDDDDGGYIERKGIVESRPEGTLMGTWVISGTSYTANEATEFGEGSAEIGQGDCVEVKVASDAPTVAIEIEAEDAEDCAEHDGDEKDGDEKDDDDGGYIERKGIVESRPEGTLMGTWVISGTSYTANEATEFGEGSAEIGQGDCVEVKVASDAPTVAIEIEAEDAEDCAEHDGDEKDDDRKNDDDDDKGEGEKNKEHEDDGDTLYGRLEVRPDGTLTGTWIIGGVAYTATESTEFNTRYGALMGNKCLKVEVNELDPTLADEISTKPSYHCTPGNGPDDDKHEGEGKLYGEILALPKDGLVGLWIVGGEEFSATIDTEFDDEDGEFGVGAMVKVEFYIDPNGDKIAEEIELKYGDDDEADEADDDDEREYGDSVRKDGKAFANVDERPGTNVGEWVIGGVVYRATEATKFLGVGGGSDIQVGDRVKVEYVLIQENGETIGLRATKIIETGENGGVGAPNHYKVVGFVTKLPDDGYLGEWIVAGAVFSATEDTEFDEENGAFALLSYVEVEYVKKDGINYIVEIETNVPPGAGDDDALGTLNSVGDAQALSVQSVSANVWSVDGVEYVVDESTQIVDNDGTLGVGSQVYVNSYDNGTGTQVATLVRTTDVAPQLFLPMADR